MIGRKHYDTGSDRENSITSFIQGSVHGLLLFPIYIDDQYHNIKDLGTFMSDDYLFILGMLLEKLVPDLRFLLQLQSYVSTRRGHLCSVNNVPVGNLG